MNATCDDGSKETYKYSDVNGSVNKILFFSNQVNWENKILVAPECCSAHSKLEVNSSKDNTFGQNFTFTIWICILWATKLTVDDWSSTAYFAMLA